MSVCDFHGCLECEGAEENVTLRGDGGWNYVMCELIGFYILVEVKEDDGSIIPNITLGICEIEILGQKGRNLTVLIHQLELLTKIKNN